MHKWTEEQAGFRANWNAVQQIWLCGL